MTPIYLSSHSMSLKSILRWSPLLLLVGVIAFAVIFPGHAFASTSGGGLEWETPLQKFAASIKGPVAFTFSLLGLIACGAALIFGGELNEFVRRFIMLILAISVLAFAANLLSSLFGVGALIT